jgi:phosphate transport system substrate-binding protein
VVQSVAVSLRGIGYTGVGFLSSGVKPLALRRHDGAPAVSPTEESAISGQYPLARPLYLYVNQPKGKAITGLERDFIRVVLSDSGQEVVSKSGFVALPLSHRLQVKAELGVL